MGVLLVCVSVYHFMHGPRGQKKVSDSLELNLHGGWEPNQGPLEEQSVVLVPFLGFLRAGLELAALVLA